jgi:plastocyanin
MVETPPHLLRRDESRPPKYSTAGKFGADSYTGFEDNSKELPAMRVKRRWRSGLVLTVLIAIILVAAAFSPLLFARQAAGTDHKPVKTTSPTLVTIPRSKNLFEPFILSVEPGTVVVWQNNDTQAHPFTTTPDRNAFLNRQSFSFDVSAGGSVHFTFTMPGLYHYFETRLDSWNSTFSRVVAGDKKINYPLSMEGIIWVQGPIANLPSTNLNFVLNGHDDFAYEFLAITRDGTVTWHNLDTNAHFVGETDGWSLPLNPADIGLYRIAGTNEVPGGDFATIIFHTPGLYYYYCRNHAQVDPVDHRVTARAMSSEFPTPMEGFVLVA